MANNPYSDLDFADLVMIDSFHFNHWLAMIAMGPATIKDSYSAPPTTIRHLIVSRPWVQQPMTLEDHGSPALQLTVRP
jgi:hypothetical protein